MGKKPRKAEAMSSRGRRPVKPEGSKVRKSKYSPAGPSHGSGAEGPKCTFVSESCEIGTKLEELKIDTSPPHEVAAPSFKNCVCQVVSTEGTKSEEPNLFAAVPHMGTKAVEPKIATSPHGETVAVPSSEKLIFQVVSIEGYDFGDFSSNFECDGSMEEESLLSDDDGGVDLADFNSDFFDSECDDNDPLANANVEAVQDLIVLPQTENMFGCKGSTTLSVIGKEAIYIAADGRVVGPPEQNAVQRESVVGGDYIKIRKLSDQIVLTIAGNTDLCDEIILNAKNLIKLTRGSDSMKFLRLKEQLRKFRRKWKKDHLGQIFPGEFMLCGKYEGKRTIFVIRHHATEKVQGLNNSAATGTGQKYAKQHLDLNVKPHSIACNYVQCLRQAIAVSALKDFNTGGRVRSGALGMGGFVRDRKVPHVLDIFFTHYDEVHYKLKGILFCMTESWKYNVECEALVEAYVRSLFGEVAVHVIAVHRRSSGVIRVIRFQDEKAASCGFKQVAGKYDCAKITVELDDARKFTVALFEPTKEIIGFFRSKFVRFDY